MNKELHISTTFDQPMLLENMVERLAYRRYDSGNTQEKMPGNRKALETSSGETYVSGTVAIECHGEHINMPFITNFLFTCTKVKNDPYKLTWATSLS